MVTDSMENHGKCSSFCVDPVLFTSREISTISGAKLNLEDGWHCFLQLFLLAGYAREVLQKVGTYSQRRILGSRQQMLTDLRYLPKLLEKAEFQSYPHAQYSCCLRDQRPSSRQDSVGPGREGGKQQEFCPFAVLQKLHQVAISCFSTKVPSYLIKKEILCSESDIGGREKRGH